jgi:Ca2+-binding RTX toxin-like protein
MSRRLPPAAAALLALALLGVAASQASASYSGSIEGGTVTLTGTAASDTLVLRVRAGAPDILEADIGADGTPDLLFDRGTFTAVDVEAGAGDDQVRLDHSGGTFADEQVTVNGGAGADTLTGDVGNDVLIGGPGNDVVDGNIGADTVRLGAGADVAQWDPGDGSDTIEGDDGADRLAFNGSNAPEVLGLSANGSRVRLDRNVGAIAMDLDGIERLDLRTLGAIDSITVGDLSGTDLGAANVDLSGNGGGGDGSADTVVARGTDGPDDIAFTSAADGIHVAGVAADIRVTGDEAADVVRAETLGDEDTITSGVTTAGTARVSADGGDGFDHAIYKGTAAGDSIQVALVSATELAAFAPGAAPFGAVPATEDVDVQGLDGADTIAVSNGTRGVTVDGGSGDDDLRGGSGPDVLLGGSGNDHVDGNIGGDVAQLGSGADVFQWDPGDGSDAIDGQGGSDRLDFNGSNAPETIGVSANGDRVRLDRNVGAIALDFVGIEALAVRALGSIDEITVNDLTGTALKTADVDLAATTGDGDLVPDTVVVNGTERPDNVKVTRTGDRAEVQGLAAQTRITGGEGNNDTLRLQTLGGDDRVTIVNDISDLLTPVISLGPDE